MKARKKPVEVDVWQFTEEDCWKSWLDDEPFAGKFSVSGHYHPRDRKIYDAWISIETLEGTMRAGIGDWIIKGVNGEFYPCKPDIFAKTYDLLPTSAAGSPHAPIQR